MGSTRTRIVARLGLVAALALASFAGGCDCGQPPVHTTHDGGTGCTTDQECQTQHGSRYTCNKTDHTCVKGPRYCDTSGEDQCCPGQVCNRAGICLDKYDTCTTDTDCTVAGQVCKTKTVNGSDQQVCTFDTCDASGACGAGLSCFAGWCVGENPCNGSCPQGQACSVSNDRCQATKACQVTCDPGTLAVFEPAGNIDDTCDFGKVTCKCEPLPPLTAKDVGRHSDLAVLSDGSAYVSAYDGDHGDLVVVAFDATGQETGTTWVDGVPATGTVVADPNGPRGGISDPGPDVGRFTGIAAAADGTLHVSYYDVDNGALKYARRSGGSWSTQTVDDAGDVGQYTSIALDGAGDPVIAYFQVGGTGNDAFTTALKVARAKSPAPTSASDWDLVTVDTGAITPPPCGGSCGSGTVCVDPGSGATCTATSGACSPACASGQTCVDNGSGGGTCQTELKASSLQGLPEGVGLMPSLVVDGSGNLDVAYYDHTDGTLKVALGVDPATGTKGTVKTIAGGSGTDQGRFPSAAIDGSGNLVVAFQDTSARSVKYAVVASDGTVSDSGTVDDGLRDPATDANTLVGNDNALLIHGGVWFVAYQNGTTGDLELSKRGAGDTTFTRQDLYTQGAAGFWAHAAWHGTQLYVSHDVLKGSATGPMDTTLRLEIVTP